MRSRSLVFAISLCVVVACCAVSEAAAARSDECAGDANLSRLRANILQAMLPQASISTNDDDCNITGRIYDAASRYAAELGPTGNWSDVSYVTTGTEGRSWWDTGVHLQRVLILGIAANLQSAAGVDPKMLLGALTSSLQFWVKEDFIQSNWWWNIIGTPRAVGKAMLLLASVDPSAAASLLPTAGPIVNRANFSHGETGTNLAWVSSGQLLLGALECNASRVTAAFRTAETTTLVNYLGQGLQHDNSFHQHGPQLYSGWGYGAIWTTLMLSFTAYSAGQPSDSPFAFSNATLDVLGTRMISNGQRWMTAGRNFDFSTCGRLMTYFSNTTGPEQLNWGHYHYYAAFSPFPNAFPDFHCHDRTPLAVNFANLLPVAAPEFDNATAADLLAYAAQVDGANVDLGAGPAGHRGFWNSDYHVHRRNTSTTKSMPTRGVGTATASLAREPFVVTVRMVSNRTINSECGNEEGKQGWDLADGATVVYVTGKEFENVFPLWDWHAVPGTVEAHAPPPTDLVKSCAEVQDRSRGQHFVGGISDDWDGAAAMDFRVAPLHLHRSWFFVGRTVVLMTVGEADSSPYNITLSLDQRWLNGNITFARQNQSAATVVHSVVDQFESIDISHMDWLHHSGIGFVPLAASTLPAEAGGPWVSFGSANRSSSWENITQGSDDPVSGVVFQATVDHGVSPSGPSRTIAHEIAMLPGIAATDMPPSAALLRDHDNWLVRSNTFEAQAACWISGGDDAQPTPGQRVFNGDEAVQSTTGFPVMQATLWYANASVSLNKCWNISIVEAPSSPGGLVVMLRKTSDGSVSVTVADPHANGGRAVLRITPTADSFSSSSPPKAAVQMKATPACQPDGDATVVTLNLPSDGPGITPGQGMAGASVTVSCSP